MKAREFNEQVDSILTPILAEAGFRKVRSSFVREVDSGQLVLLRFAGSKFASFCQFTNFMLCFRHTFLRDGWEKVPEPLPKECSSYPFRIRPSHLKAWRWRLWHYRFNLNATEHTAVNYGRLNDAKPLLTRMGQAVTSNGLRWAERFSEEEALRLLSSSRSPAFIEKLWIEDYRERLRNNVPSRHR